MSGKAYTLFKVSGEYVRTYVPKDSSLILIRIPLLLLFPSLRPLNKQDSLSCSLLHQEYESNIRGGARKIENTEKWHCKRKKKASKGWRDISTGKQVREKKHKSNTVWLTIEQQWRIGSWRIKPVLETFSFNFILFFFPLLWGKTLLFSLCGCASNSMLCWHLHNQLKVLTG